MIEVCEHNWPHREHDCPKCYPSQSKPRRPRTFLDYQERMEKTILVKDKKPNQLSDHIAVVLMLNDLANRQMQLDDAIQNLCERRMEDIKAICDLQQIVQELQHDIKLFKEAFDDHERYTVSLEERLEKVEKEELRECGQCDELEENCKCSIRTMD